MSDDELATRLIEEANAPACGSCVNLAGFLRAQAVVMLERANGRVYPPSVGQGWSQLRETRWHTAKMEDFMTRDFSADRYELIAGYLDPARIREGVEIEETTIERIRQTRESAKDDSGGSDAD
jgi:hypothetical protein